MMGIPPVVLVIFAISAIGLVLHLLSLRRPRTTPPTDESPAVFGFASIWRYGLHLLGLGLLIWSFFPGADETAPGQFPTSPLLGFVLWIACVAAAEYFAATHKIKVYETHIVCKKFGAEEDIAFADLDSINIIGSGIYIRRASGRVLSYGIGFARTSEMVALIRQGIQRARVQTKAPPVP